MFRVDSPDGAKVAITLWKCAITSTHGKNKWHYR